MSNDQQERHYLTMPQVTPEIIENVFRQECWSLTQLIAWVGTRNPKAVAVGSESLSPWVTSGLVDEAAYALLAWVSGELDDTTLVQIDTTPAQHDAHVYLYDVQWRIHDAHVRLRHRLLADKAHALARKNWRRWGAEAESKLRTGLLGLTEVSTNDTTGDTSSRSIPSSECTGLRLIGGNLTLLPKLTRQNPAHTDSPVAIKSPQVSRERVLAEFPPQIEEVARDAMRASPELAATAQIGPARRGRRAKYDWDEAAMALTEALDDHGDYDEQGQMADWNCQARAENFVTRHFEKPLHGGVAPSEGRVRSFVRETVAAWRKSKGQ